MESKTLKIVKKDELVYIQFPKLLKCDGVRHIFSTRHGGVSEGDCKSMNLNFERDSNRENVIKNYKILCDAVGIDFDGLVLSKQTHTNNVVTVTEEHRGTGISKPSFNDVDGLVTNCPKVGLVTQYADCTPLVFYDPVKRVIATSHAGWRGTVKLIGKCTVDKMVKEFGCDPKDIIAGIGPNIGQCCYEVDDPVIDEFKKLTFLNLPDFVTPKGGGKYMLNLAEANRQILIHSGIKPENIDITDICTCCNSEDLHSHRASKGKRGTIGIIIELTE